MLTMSRPQNEANHDLFENKIIFKEITRQMEDARIDTHDILLNTNTGFYSYQFRNIRIQNKIQANIQTNPKNPTQQGQRDHCLDQKLYKRSMAIERDNPWKDGFKNLILIFLKNLLIAKWISSG